MIRRSHAIIPASLAPALLLACGSPVEDAGPETPTASRGEATPARAEETVGRDSLVISQRGDALTLDPYDENETPTFSILSNIFDPLVDMGPNIDVVPALAASWEVVEDTTWVFHLEQGVTFHNGNAFTADDAVFSLERAINWDGSEVKADVSTVAGARAIDDHTLEITTHGPDPILLRRLTGIHIMDRETTERDVAEQGERWLVEHPTGTGPYRLIDWFREERLTLEAYEDHWRGAPEIKHVEFRPISNDQTRVFALLSGDVDLISEVPVTQTQQVESAPGVRLLQCPSLRLIYLVFDTWRDESPGLPDSPPNPFKDQRVRRAIYHAINEDAIVRQVMNGFAIPAAQLVPPAVFGNDPDIERLPHDPERARALLAEAGFPDGFRVQLDAPNNRYVNDWRIAQAIAGQLAQVGIEVDVDTRAKSLFFDDEEQSNLSFYLIGWSNSNGDAAGSFEYLLHTYDPELQLGTGNNHSSRYSNPALDALIDQSRVTMDPAEREDILQEAMRLVMEDLPHIPLHFQVNLFAAADGLQWQPRQDTRLRAADMAWR